MALETLTSKEQFVARIETISEGGEYKHEVTRGIFYHPDLENSIRDLVEMHEEELKHRETKSAITIFKPEEVNTKFNYIH